MIDKKKIGKNTSSKYKNYESPNLNEEKNDEASDMNCASSTQRYFLRQIEDSKEVSFNDISNNNILTFNAIDKNNDISYISTADGANKRRKLFELDEQEIGSTFRNINLRKDQYSDNLQNNQSEENIYRKETIQKFNSQTQSRDLTSNPFNLSDKISEILNTEEAYFKGIKKDETNYQKHPSIEFSCKQSTKKVNSKKQNTQLSNNFDKSKKQKKDSESEEDEDENRSKNDKDKCQSILKLQRDSEEEDDYDDQNSSSQNTDKKTQKNSIFDNSPFTEDMIIELNVTI